MKFEVSIQMTLEAYNIDQAMQIIGLHFIMQSCSIVEENMDQHIYNCKSNIEPVPSTDATIIPAVLYVPTNPIEYIKYLEALLTISNIEDVAIKMGKSVDWIRLRLYEGGHKHHFNLLDQKCICRFDQRDSKIAIDP